MKRMFAAALLLAGAAVVVALAYQAAATDRSYRAYLGEGAVALADDQTFGAIEAYSGAIALRPDSMLAHLRRGEAYQHRNELEAATRDFRRAADLDPSATRPLEALGDVLYQRGRYQRSAEMYERRLAVDSLSTRVSLKLAVARYRAGQIDRALAAAREAVRLDENLADAHYLIGLCLRERQQPAEAVAALEKAAAISPALVPAREELAELYAALGRRGDELEQLQLIAVLDRARPERQVAVGLAQARAGQEELAVLTLGHALDRTPGHPLIYGALGQVWLRQAVSRSDSVALGKALEALERASATDDATSTTLGAYGRALLMDNQIEAAERVLLQATRRYPVDPIVLPTYAAVAERLDHAAAARTALLDYGALVSDEADFGARAASIARLSLRLEDRATAAAWIARGLEKDSGNAALQALDTRVKSPIPLSGPRDSANRRPGS